MWSWADTPAAELVDFAADQGIDRLYLYVYRARGAELERLQEISGLAGAAGIELWALSGDPRWALDHKQVLSWQKRALQTGLFVGTHLDVEPYSLRAWKQHRERVVAKYVAMLDKVQQADPRPLDVDVPFWLGTIDGVPGGAGTLADDVLERVDAITVMSYRDTATGPNSLSAVAADLIARGDEAEVPVELGVETNDLGPRCEHCTFYEEDGATLRQVVGEVDAIMASHPSYAGFAVHDAAGFAALLER